MRTPRRSLLPVLVLASLATLGGGPDPGLLLEVDLAAFRLAARDLGDAAAGPTLRVAVGSPSHPTPRGEFSPRRVVLNPRWTPGPHARSLGARPLPPSSDGPLGAGKMPLEHGAIQIHAGAEPLELGKPTSLGCVAVADESWHALVSWIEERGGLHPWRRRPEGDAVGEFHRPVRVVVR